MSHEDTVTIEINRAVFRRLQALAEPLVDNTSSLVEKLVEHWELHPPASLENKDRGTLWWFTSRGERLPVGTKLRAIYNGHTYEATVKPGGIFFESEIFNSPSAAAIHAKNLEGLTGASANTNGWNFWEYYDEAIETWKPLSVLRSK
ncbi:MAG: hypothetical protein WBN57_02590 [Gammaproteobacteria bacterium]